MKRFIIIVLLMLMAGFAYSAPPARTYPYVAGGIIQPAEVTANEDNIFRYLTAGVDTLSANSVTNSNLFNDCVTSAKILDGTIVSADISNSAAIPYSKLTLTGLISGTDLAGNIAINTTGAITTTATTTTSGLYVTGLIKDNNGNWGTNGQALTTSGSIVEWKQMGRVIQVANYQTGALHTDTTAIPYDNTPPQITEGHEYMTLAITPTLASNRLRIDVVVNISGPAGVLVAALFQDATVDALACGAFDQADGLLKQITFTYYMTAGTITPTTFRVRANGSGAGTWSLNGQGGNGYYLGTLMSSITITELTQ